MGIYDRDYYRENSGRFFESWGRQGATVWIVIITCFTFVAQIVTNDAGGAEVERFGIYDFKRVAAGEAWRLLTPLFLHGGMWHLACNMFVLYWVGSRMEERYGSKEFLAFYLLAGVTANALNFLVQLAGLMPESRGLGASGAVNAALVLYALHYPHQRVLLFFVIPMPVWLLVVGYVALDTMGVFGFGQRGVGHVVHLAGAFFGVAYFQFDRRITDLIPSRSGRAKVRPAPKLRIVNPEPEPPSEPVGAAVETPPRPAEAADEHLEAKVDAVLEKVSKYGPESLTSEEREILFRASEVYKRRRK